MRPLPGGGFVFNPESFHLSALARSFPGEHLGFGRTHAWSATAERAGPAAQRAH